MNGERQPGDTDEPGEILDDLESIKDLLDEADGPEAPTLDVQQSAREEVQEELDVPLLDDAIEEAEDTQAGMADDTFNALLGDAWQDSVDQLFAEARANIERNSQDWLPEDTDNLAEALKVRIDKSVKAWLADTLQANIGVLRERIVHELSEEILSHMKNKLTPTGSRD